MSHQVRVTERGLSRLRDLSRNPLVVDISIAVATAAFGVTRDRWGDDSRTLGVAWAFDIALAAPLVWRRRAPLAVFCAVSTIAFGVWLSDKPVTGSVAVLVALYAVGAYERRAAAIVFCTSVAQVGAVMAAARWGPVDHRLTAFLLLTGTVTAAWVMGVYARTRRDLMSAALDRAATAERERDQRALLATAAERDRISREMHDIVAHTLSVMVALSDGAAISVDRDAGSARDAMQQSAVLGRQALSDLRRLLAGVRTPGKVDLTPVPGIAQVEDLVAAVRSAGLDVDLVMTGQPLPMAPSLQLAVYRLVQESLTNVLKHAPGAGRARVTLRCSTDTIQVDVVNDGHAEAASRAAPASGSGSGSEGQGLTGMRERAAVFGGTVEAGPRPTGEWRVSVLLSRADDRADS